MSNTMKPAMVRKVAPTATQQDFSVAGANMPGTLWVRPAGGTWTIAYSTDNGANYNSLTALTGASAYTEVIVEGGFTNLRITPSGTAGGTWGIA